MSKDTEYPEGNQEGLKLLRESLPKRLWKKAAGEAAAKKAIKREEVKGLEGGTHTGMQTPNLWLRKLARKTFKIRLREYSDLLSSLRTSF